MKWVTLILVMNANIILGAGAYLVFAAYNHELMEIDPVEQNLLALHVGQLELGKQHVIIYKQNARLWKQAKECKARKGLLHTLDAY